MKIFIAGTNAHKYLKEDIEQSMYILESFYYIQDWQIPLIKKTKMFLLDSGAFTFMNNCMKGEIDFENYLERYINFINKHNIKYFFELDIDSVVGYNKVKEFRKKLEEKTNKKCIPVWHKTRGLEEFIKLTKEYDYIAIGGFVIKEIKKEEYKYIPKLLKIAKENKCKVRGLGFTSVSNLKRYRFNSVDSTSWASGGRFGQVLFYRSGKFNSITNKGKKVKPRYTDKHNLQQWLKFQKDADKYL